MYTAAMRLAAPIAVVLALSLSGAVAADTARYALSAAKDGFVRLDTVTGAVSHCRPVNGAWQCQPIAGIDDARLQALASEVAKLTADVAVLGSRLDQLAAGKAAPTTSAAAAPTVPPSVAVAPVVSAAPTATAPPHHTMIAEALDRFLGLVRRLKHGHEAA